MIWKSNNLHIFLIILHITCYKIRVKRDTVQPALLLSPPVPFPFANTTPWRTPNRQSLRRKVSFRDLFSASMTCKNFSDLSPTHTPWAWHQFTFSPWSASLLIHRRTAKSQYTLSGSLFLLLDFSRAFLQRIFLSLSLDSVCLRVPCCRFMHMIRGSRSYFLTKVREQEIISVISYYMHKVRSAKKVLVFS